MVDTIPHVVRQGEHLYEIATRYQSDVEQIWGLPENRSLKDQGRAPEQLCAGDVVYVPRDTRQFLSVKVGERNVFTATVPTVTVTVTLRGDDGKGIPNVAFEVPSLGLTGQTDGEGHIRLEHVPQDQKVIQIHLPDRDLTLEVGVGHLDPASTWSGRAQRLAHLGYLPSADDATEDAVRNAFDAFCSAHAPDAATEADRNGALVAAHGS